MEKFLLVVIYENENRVVFSCVLNFNKENQALKKAERWINYLEKRFGISVFSYNVSIYKEGRFYKTIRFEVGVNG